MESTESGLRLNCVFKGQYMVFYLSVKVSASKVSVSVFFRGIGYQMMYVIAKCIIRVELCDSVNEILNDLWAYVTWRRGRRVGAAD